jgi:glucokinase
MSSVYILAGDVGGTNTNLAIMKRQGEKFSILLEHVTPSAEVKDFLDPLKALINEGKTRGITIDLCSISAAGPIKNNTCQMTNADFFIDGGFIERETGIKTLLINDFIAISYGLPLLDIEDEKQILKVPHPGRLYPKENGMVRVVVGAGTGLGMSTLVHVHDTYFALPAEGGHVDFAPWDDDTWQLKQYVAKEIGDAPGAELLISGSGIARIFRFLVEKEKATSEPGIQDILSSPVDRQPAMVSSSNHPLCKKAMEFFVRLYGKYASNLALTTLPMRGLYLAGGIVTKNEKIFLQDDLFINAFEQNYNSIAGALLKDIPVYIIRDYSTSLYGAANAAVYLL